MVFYAVAKGRKTGVFTKWDDAKKLVIGYNGAKFKKFETYEEAEDFVGVKKKTMSMTSFVEREEPAESDRVLICFTDGACHGNGKKDAKASYAVVWPYHEDMNVGHRLHGDIITNNRAEYSGIIYAINQAETLDPLYEKTLIIYSDSMLVIKSMTEWLHGWKKNNWKKSDGQPVLNVDLIQMLDAMLEKRKVVFKHVRAHTGGSDWESIWNDKVDKLASSMLAN